MCQCPGVARTPPILICWYDKPCHTWNCCFSGGLLCCIPNQGIDNSCLSCIWWTTFIVTLPIAFIIGLILGFLGFIADLLTLFAFCISFGFCCHKCCWQSCDDCGCISEYERMDPCQFGTYCDCDCCDENLEGGPKLNEGSQSVFKD
jgi:hypothetical protein